MVLEGLGGAGDHPGQDFGLAECGVQLWDGYGAHRDGQHDQYESAGEEIEHAAEEAFNAFKRGDVGDPPNSAPGDDAQPLSDGQAEDEYTDHGDEAPLASDGGDGQGYEPGGGADAQAEAEEGTEGCEETATNSGEEVEQKKNGDDDIKGVNVSHLDETSLVVGRNGRGCTHAMRPVCGHTQWPDSRLISCAKP